MKTIFSTLIFIISLSLSIRAQEQTAELMYFRLPPIDTLFKGALKSSMVEFYDLRMEGEQLLLKTEKRKWLEFFNLAGTYQYGIIGMNSFMDLGENYPLVYQYTGQEQLFYNAGASFRIPLDRLFDRNNRIKRQKLKINEMLKERDMWYDEQKAKIIELYFRAQELINNLRPLTEYVTLSDEQYKSALSDYTVSKITMQELNAAKGVQVQATMQLERGLADLKSAIMRLEILSNTKILNK